MVIRVYLARYKGMNEQEEEDHATTCEEIALNFAFGKNGKK